MNPEGVEEELYVRSSGDEYEGREVDGDINLRNEVSQDNMSPSATQQIAALEAELADVKVLNANIATAVRQITSQFEHAMVAGIVENGTGGISDGWSQVGSYGGVPMLMADPSSTPGEYDFVMTMGPVGKIVMLPLSERARNDELHRLHRAVLALRGMLIGAGMSTELLNMVVSDIHCGSCHLDPIEPDRRSTAQRIVDEYEARVGRRRGASEDSLVADVAGLRARESQAEQPPAAGEQLTVATGRSPRHLMKLAVARLFEEWDIGGFDHDGLNDPLPSAQVLARNAVDLLDREGLLLKIYEAGLRRGMARAQMIADLPGDSAMPMRTQVRTMFEKYWLGR